jgi:DNA-nicking Smr family endonuclease
MSDDDLHVFLQEMEDVTPILVEKKVTLIIEKPGSPGQAHRHANAQDEASLDINHLSSCNVHMVKPHDVLSFQRDGLQNSVFKRLKKGSYRTDARLDLHNKTVEEARIDVFDFIQECVKYDLRSIMIIHGKGHTNTQQPALLKSYVQKWLLDIDNVQAFHSAQQRHGGTGALYIMLAKGEKTKL